VLPVGEEDERNSSIISGGSPEKYTLARTDPSYWPVLLLGLAFSVTFPQAVMRAQRIHLAGSTSPQTVFYRVKKAVPFIAGVAYCGGEWIFVLLMLIGCALVTWLAGKSIFIKAAREVVSHG
jgi:hypothetical protein